MTLEILKNEMISAMKNGEKVRKSVISDAIAAVKRAAIDKGCRDNIPEELVNEVLLKEQKTIKEMVDTCPSNLIELFNDYNEKFRIISEFAPKLVQDKEEIKKMIFDIVNNEYEFEKKNKGIIMKTVMPSLKGKVDMAIAKSVLEKLF